MTNTKKAVIVKGSNAAKAEAAAPKKFTWDEKNQAVIAEGYQAQLKLDHTKANSNAFLTTLAVQVGAKSGQAVRSKLSSLKEYRPLDKTSAQIAKPRVTKPLLADEIRDKLQAAGVDISDESANSLANSNAAALKAVIAGLDMLDAPSEK